MSNTIVIIGDKGAGKTSLFRYLIANYSDEKNVKISPIVNYNHALLNINGVFLKIIDTPSWNTSAKNLIECEIQKSILNLIKECYLICWVIDSLNENAISISRVLRKIKKKKCVLINQKDDNENVENYSALGIEDCVHVSTWSRIDLEPFINLIKTNLLNNQLVVLNNETDKELKKNKLSLLILGLPNSGKSTLMNFLLKQERSLVTEIKGTTREAVFDSYFLGGIHFQLIDTAGIDNEKEIDKSLWRKCELALILIDATVFISKQILKLSKLGNESYKSSIVIVNKIDLVSNVKVKQIRNYLKPLSCPVITTSLLKKWGVSSLLAKIYEIINQSKKALTKNKLNNTIKKIIANNPRFYKNKQLKFYFAKQKKEFDFLRRFILFINYPELINNAYNKYLVREIKKKLELVNEPQLIFKRSRKIEI